MFNAQKPAPEDLPSARSLLRSTLIALAAAGGILVAVVWPAEYGIDPTGIGGALGLTEMGEIKTQPSEEAEADRRAAEEADESSGLGAAIFALFVGTAQAQKAWRDEVSLTLAPSEGKEVKLVMKKGAVARFAWVAEGGAVNFDLHGDGGGESISYEKGRGVPGAEGELTAAFDGEHGWFWRNRTGAPVTVTLRATGDYAEVKRY